MRAFWMPSWRKCCKRAIAGKGLRVLGVLGVDLGTHYPAE